MYFVWLILILFNFITSTQSIFYKKIYLNNNLKNFFSTISPQDLTHKIIVLDFLNKGSDKKLFYVLNNERVNIYSFFFTTKLVCFDTKKNFFLNKIIFNNNIEKKFFSFFKKINFLYYSYRTNEKKILKFFFFKSLNFSILKKYLKLNFLSFNKFISKLNKNNFIVYYLRKNKIFNKSRYSRNRQIYRTGVYWCLWVNIIFVYGLYYYFYRFSFNFGYLWIGLFIFIVSFFFSRLVQFNLFNFNNVIKEIIFFKNWCFTLIINFNHSLKKFFI